MASSATALPTLDTRAFANPTLPNGKLAMWIFLGSEVMMFAGWIGTYVVLRVANPDIFHPDFLEKHYARLNIPLAALNTLVLIFSSLTMVLAVQGVWRKDNAQVKKYLLITALCGIGFMVIKAIEYNQKFGHGIYPSTSIFYSCYFVLTGIHAIHVICGVVPMLLFLWLARDGRFVRDGNITIELFGLYWHFVDIVWIFLFPLLYLIR